MTRPPLKRVVIADDHYMIRVSLSFALQTVPDIEIVGEAKNAYEAVKLCRMYSPDVLLVDWMISNINIVEFVHSFSPHTQIIVLAGVQDEDAIKQAALHLGTFAYVLKNASINALMDIMSKVGLKE